MYLIIFEEFDIDSKTFVRIYVYGCKMKCECPCTTENAHFVEGHLTFHYNNSTSLLSTVIGAGVRVCAVCLCAATWCGRMRVCCVLCAVLVTVDIQYSAFYYVSVY